MSNPQTTTKIWQIGAGLHPLVEQYTVGNDYVLDQQLIPYDVAASRAHAHMLTQMGVLTNVELKTLQKAFDQLLTEWKQGTFTITQSQEDGHTAIEQYLTQTCGDLGKKIHTGRSRNDQALVMMRLFEKEQLTQLSELLQITSKAYRVQAKKHQKLPMPGYTHMQRAMPATVGMWLGSFADGFADSVAAVDAALNLIDQNPLGSASGFGIGNFPLQREATTQVLDFAKTQQNPMYCGLSRGMFETVVLNALAMPMMLAGRFAADMLLFTTEEYDFVRLPQAFTTGSSIMPNKQNYDLFEIMRANTRVFAAYQQQVQQITSGLYSGYSRDLQLTKEPTIKGLQLAAQTIQLLCELLPVLEVKVQKMQAAMSSDLFATERVYALVQQGASFRDAYQQVKKELAQQTN